MEYLQVKIFGIMITNLIFQDTKHACQAGEVAKLVNIIAILPSKIT